ncbi:MAG: formylmethanofuran dehydrogenase subunit E family protein [Candidatus Omnitrophota bacterium]|jgi:formylmethanofuran dehydrogenase subunit E
MISLKEGIRFHGHLGPYLVLGIRAGELALKKLNCKKYFGLEVKVWGAGEKPKSCLIDGLQLSTGATYGKGNISKFNGRVIRIGFKNKVSRRKLILKFKNTLLKDLAEADTHQKAERLARQLYKKNHAQLFNLKLTSGD